MSVNQITPDGIAGLTRASPATRFPPSRYRAFRSPPGDSLNILVLAASMVAAIGIAGLGFYLVERKRAKQQPQRKDIYPLF